MGFLQTYLDYNSGNESPRNFHLWSGLVVLAAAAQRRVYTDRGYFRLRPNLYVGLIGQQGLVRKSTAKGIAKDLYTTTFPDMPIGASVTSKEDIIRLMSSDSGLRVFKDHNGLQVEYRPYVLFINELKDFLNFNPIGMIDFLTNIYDQDVFDSSTIKRSLEKIINPCVNILACETPEWITDKLKSKVISGGFARRIIYIYETEQPRRISFPEPPAGHKEMWAKMQAHLRHVATLTGPFTWSQKGKAFYDKYYQSVKPPTDEVMSGYYASKPDQLIKVAMGLAMSDDNPKLELTEENFELGLAMLDAIEVNMPKLSQSAGRNELAVPTQKVMELLERAGGMIPEKILKRDINKDLSPMEQMQVLRFLQETEQIYIVPCEVNGVKKVMVMTKRKKEDVEKGTA